MYQVPGNRIFRFGRYYRDVDEKQFIHSIFFCPLMLRLRKPHTIICCIIRGSLQSGNTQRIFKVALIEKTQIMSRQMSVQTVWEVTLVPRNWYSWYVVDKQLENHSGNIWSFFLPTGTCCARPLGPVSLITHDKNSLPSSPCIQYDHCTAPSSPCRYVIVCSPLQYSIQTTNLVFHLFSSYERNSSWAGAPFVILSITSNVYRMTELNSYFNANRVM